MADIETGAPQENQVTPQETPIDYDKLASIIDGKIKVTEESVLKGYMKQQGLTGDELTQAIDAFKADRASKQPNFDELNKQIAEKDDALLEAQSRALFAETKMEAMAMAGELGVDAKVIPFLLNSADISNVIVDGEISKEKLMESLNEVLKDIPQLKVENKRDEKVGFKIGADTSKQNPSSNDELAKIFGIKK